MGIVAEYCPDLALREFGTEGKSEDECLPEKLDVGKRCGFLKLGQKHYWFFGEIPLRETKGGGVLSRPMASVKIIEATHFLKDGSIWTKGIFEVVEVYDLNDGVIHFDGLEKING